MECLGGGQADAGVGAEGAAADYRGAGVGDVATAQGLLPRTVFDEGQPAVGRHHATRFYEARRPVGIIEIQYRGLREAIRAGLEAGREATAISRRVDGQRALGGFDFEALLPEPGGRAGAGSNCTARPAA